MAQSSVCVIIEQRLPASPLVASEDVGVQAGECIGEHVLGSQHDEADGHQQRRDSVVHVLQ